MGSSVNNVRRKAGLRSGNRWLRPDKYNSDMWKDALKVKAAVATGTVLMGPVGGALAAGGVWKGRREQKKGGGGGGGGDGGFEGFDPIMPEMSDINWADFFGTGGTDVGGPARVGTLDPLGVRSRRSRGTAGLRGNRDRTLGQSSTIASAAARAGLNLPV